MLFRSPLRLLVAGDNAVSQPIMKAFLTSAGHVFTVVDDGAQALRAHRDAPFDVILMDVQMPVLDGITATRAVRALPGPTAHAPIMVITANAMPGDRELYLAPGMDDDVSKPINRANLYTAIEQARARIAHVNGTLYARDDTVKDTAT